MSQVVFSYNGQNIIIQCNSYDLIYEIFQKFSTKANKDLNSLYFLYNGCVISNQFLKLDEIMNSDDKIRNKMNILVQDNQNIYSSQSNITSAQTQYSTKSYNTYNTYNAYPSNVQNYEYTTNTNVEYNVVPAYTNIEQNYSSINKFPLNNYNYTQNIPQNYSINYSKSYDGINISNNNNTLSNKDYNIILQTVNDSNKRIEELEKEIKSETQKLKLKIEDMQKRLRKANKQRKIFTNGIYNGEIQNGLLNGLGIFQGDDGNKYEGEYLNDERNGVGIYYYKDGNIYQGEFKGGKFHGYTIEENLDVKYEGTYVDDCLSGRGIFTFKNGIKYIGQCYKAKFFGFGKKIWPDGSYFIGEFKDGYRFKGILFYSEDRGFFDSTWEFKEEKDKINSKGEGIYYLPNGKKEKRKRIINGEKGYWQYN